MSTALAFDTLKLVDALEKVKLPRDQARAIVEVVRESRTITLAEQSNIAQDASARAVAELDSKTDKALALLRKDMETGFALVHREMDTRFAQFHNEMDARFAQLSNDMDTRFAAVDTRFTQTDNVIALLRKDTEAGFALMDKKIELIDQRSQARFKFLYWMFGGLMAALFAIAAALAPAALRMYFGG